MNHWSGWCVHNVQKLLVGEYLLRNIAGCAVFVGNKVNLEVERIEVVGNQRIGLDGEVLIEKLVKIDFLTVRTNVRLICCGHASDNCLDHFGRDQIGRVVERPGKINRPVRVVTSNEGDLSKRHLVLLCVIYNSLR